MAPSPDGDVALATPSERSAPEQTGFRLTLSNFDGPFDLLVTLIAKHDLDITEVALSVVTNEFLTYLHDLDSDEELEQAS